MSRFRMTKRRMALAAVPAAAILAGGAGVAVAAVHGGDQGAENDHPSYHSSLTVPAPRGSAAEQDAALAALAKVGLPQAIQTASHAVAGGSVVGIDLSNEGGNVVYLATVVHGQSETEVVIDAGNGRVLAQQAERDNERADASEGADGPTSTAPGQSSGTPGSGGSASSHSSGPAGATAPATR